MQDGPLVLCLHCMSQQRPSTSLPYSPARVLMLAFGQFSKYHPISFGMNYSPVCGTPFLLSAVKEVLRRTGRIHLLSAIPPPPKYTQTEAPPPPVCMPAREHCSPNPVDMTEIAQVKNTELRHVGQRLHFRFGVLPCMCSLRILSYRREIFTGAASVCSLLSLQLP